VPLLLVRRSCTTLPELQTADPLQIRAKRGHRGLRNWEEEERGISSLLVVVLHKCYTTPRSYRELVCVVCGAVCWS
jgi:hypothetical protein